ncbi:hypothetical protein NKI56_19240 [Mesorhizobium sp. M0622]|uniref:hypothetical protein n=1 Tax=unclassified Mesorhizobium TaxID=325217 RepID=UPI0033394DEF
MRRLATENRISRGLSQSRSAELVRYAIDRLGIESANSLPPRDRARLASATAVLKELCERLESCFDQPR